MKKVNQSNNKHNGDKSDSKTVAMLLLIQNAVLDKRISSVARDVLTRLLTHFNHKTGLCNPSEKTLMEALGVGESSVKRFIKQLKDNGWIFIEHRFRNSNHYRFNWDKAVKIDLKSKHSGGSSVTPLKNIEKGQNEIEKGHFRNPEGSFEPSRRVIFDDLVKCAPRAGQD